MWRGLIFTLVFLGLVIGVWELLNDKEQLPPEQAVQQQIDTVVAAAQKQDLKGILNVVSKKFSGQGMDRDQVKAILFVHLQRNSWRTIFLVNVDVNAVSQTEVKASIDAVLAGGGQIKTLQDVVPDRAGAYHFDLTFGLEEDVWRVTTGQFKRRNVTDFLN